MMNESCNILQFISHITHIFTVSLVQLFPTAEIEMVLNTYLITYSQLYIHNRQGGHVVCQGIS